jgi:hypothetical protein
MFISPTCPQTHILKRCLYNVMVFRGRFFGEKLGSHEVMRLEPHNVINALLRRGENPRASYTYHVVIQ